MSKRIRVNAFDMSCITHQSPGLWAHPEDQSRRYKELDYWIELAKLLERGKFDSLFIAGGIHRDETMRGGEVDPAGLARVLDGLPVQPVAAMGALA